MANNKLIVLFVFAALAQAALANASKKHKGSSSSSSSSSSNIQKAKQASHNAWSKVADTVCKAIRDKSWSIESGREEYRKHQVEGGKGFRKVARNAKDQTLLVESAAFSTAFRDAVFRGIAEARKCRDFNKTKGTLKSLKNELPYDGIMKDFQKMSGDSGKRDQAVKAFKEMYEKIFHEIEKLAKSVSEGKHTNSCSTKEIVQKVDVVNNYIYNWVQKHHQ